MQLSEGAILQNGKYQIEKVLGQGGFGITYLAHQESLKRDVCIKEFFMRDFCNRSETNSSVTLGTSANKELIEHYLNKFIKEARTIAALEHPNIIHIYDIFKENNTAYYVMDYIEGESLSEMVKRRGALPEEEAVTYIRSVAEALKYVHQRRINHLDVKPGNIMVRRSDNHVFLLDFGLSKQYDTAGNQTSSTPLGISHGFAPIEQYSPEGIKEFSPQTDIYSLGATLYYLITGTTPPPASELFSTELGGFPDTVSASVKEAIQKAMKLQKGQRPQNIDAFLDILCPDKFTNYKNKNNTYQTTEETIPIQEKKIISSNIHKKFGNKLLFTIIILIIIFFNIYYWGLQNGNNNENQDIPITNENNYNDNKYEIAHDTCNQSNIPNESNTPSKSNGNINKFAKDKWGICTTKTVDLGLSVMWAGWNVGASKPEDYGGLYQPDSYNKRGWEDGWRLPTEAEIDELSNNCTWIWFKYKGIQGKKVTGPNGNSIFLPAAGIREENNMIKFRNLYGGYWASDVSASTTGGYYQLTFNNFEGLTDEDGMPLLEYGYFRYCDKSVRLVHE